MSEIKRKALIVDDSKTMREMVNFTLVREGMEVIQAEDGVEALEMANDNKNNIDIVITDINMPNMDGITLIAELRKVSEFKYIPILTLTTESDASKKEEGKKAGATGWIVKPFNPEKLIKVINKVLS
ncbi:MAG: response regulator [Pseudomonadota bacterium]